MNEAIIEQLTGTFKHDFDLIQDDLGAIERAVQEKMQLLGQGLLQRLVDCQSNGYKESSIACKCGGVMKFVQHRKRNIHTVFGWVTVKRAYYHCSGCGAALAPYDKSSGLVSEQLIAGLAKACCLFAVDDSFEQTSRKIEQLFGQSVSDDAVKQVSHQVVSMTHRQHTQEFDYFRADRQIPQAQSEPEKLYVSVDGTTVAEVDAWHEVKIGCIYW